MGRLAHLHDINSPTARTLADQLSGVDHEMEELCETVEAMQRTLATIPTEKAPDINAIREAVCTEVAAVLEALTGLKRTIQAIPAPVIPKPAPVDLTPVLQAIRDIPAPVASPLAASLPEAPRPKEWTFDLEHDQYGNIVRVRATAGR